MHELMWLRIKSRLHWPVAFLFFLALAIFIYRIPLLQTDPHYFVLLQDLEVPIYFHNLLRLFYPLWNDMLSIMNLVTGFQINIMFFLFAGLVLAWSPMTTVNFIFVAATTLSGFFGYVATFVILKRSEQQSKALVMASLIAGLMLVINQLWTADPLHYGKKISFVFAIPMFLFFWLGFKNKRFSYLLAGTIAMVLYTAGPRNLISASILFIMLTVYYLLLDVLRNKRNWRASLRSLLLYLKYGVLSVIAFVLLDAYRLMPVLYRSVTVGFPTAYLATFESGLKGVEGATLINALRYDLFAPSHHWAWATAPAFLQVQLVQLLIFYLPFVLFFSAVSVALSRLTDQDYILLLVNLCFWTILSTGLNPLGFPGVQVLYYWIMFRAPLHQYVFWAFRHPTQIWFLGQMFCAFLVGALSLRLLRHVGNPKLPVKSRVLGAAILILCLSAILLPSWPILTGNFGGVYQPVKVPDCYFELNQWFEQQSGDFKVLWLPFYTPTVGSWSDVAWLRNQTTPQLQHQVGIQWFDLLSSSRGTYEVWVTTSGKGIPMESYLINLLSVNYAYQFDFIQSNRTENLGRMLAPLDIRYVVLNTEIVPAKAATVLQVLQHQKDLRFVRQQDFFFVFENLEYVSHVFSTSNAILVEGGRDVFSALTCIDSFNSSKTALIFLDEQTPWDASVLNSSDTIILHDWHNLLPIVDPSDLQPISGQVLHENLYFPTYWSKAQASDIRFGVWTSTLVANHVPNWDFDFGQGFVFTDRPGAELTIPVNVKEDADYILFLRYLPSKVGGRFSLIEDGIKVNTIQTLSNSTRFSLSQIGPMHLAKGQHVFDLRNEMGFNAINYVMLIPLDKLSSYFEKILGMIGSKQVVYLKSAGLDFNYSNSSLTTIHGGSSMNGLALEFGVHGSAWTFLNPDKAARYVIAISNPAPAQPGELQLSIGNYSFRFSFGPGSSRFAYTQPIYLEPKRYSLIISKIRGDPSVDGVLAYSSSNNSTVDKLFNRGGSSKIVNFEEVSPTRYSITVDANKPFWLFLGETYDPDWVAYVGARQIRPVLSYQSVNGYLVNSTGKVHLTIEYVLQKFFDYGAAISFATLIVVLASIFVESRRIASNSRRPFG